MILGALLCKLPRWLGGGHKDRRPTKKERESPGIQIMASALGGTIQQLRLCRRCGIGRIAAKRKAKQTEQAA